MKHFKVIGLISLLMIIMGFTLAYPVMAIIAPPDSPPTIQAMKFYRNILETGDRLLLVEFTNPYAATPAEPASKTFVWQLIDVSGGSDNITGSASGYSYVDSGYGEQAIALYFDADVGLTWNPATAYILRLQGTPAQFAAPLPEYNYPVSSTAYSSLTATADVKAELALDIIVICEDLDAAWGLTDSLLYEDDAGTVLSAFGQAYWRGNVPGIQSMAPALFPLAIENIDKPAVRFTSATDNYSISLTNQYNGTWIQTAREAQKAFFGVDFNLLDLIIVFGAAIGVIIGNILLTNDHWNGIIDACFLLVVFTRMGMYEMGYMGLVAAIGIIYMAASFRGKFMGG